MQQTHGGAETTQRGRQKLWRGAQTKMKDENGELVMSGICTYGSKLYIFVLKEKFIQACFLCQAIEMGKHL